MTTRIQKLQKAPQIIYRIVEEDAIILDTKNGLYYVLDKVGACVWQYLMSGKALDEMAEEINKKYQVSNKDDVKGDIKELIHDMLKDGLLEVCKS